MPEPPGHREGLPRSLASPTAGWPTHSWGHSESPASDPATAAAHWASPWTWKPRAGLPCPRYPPPVSTHLHLPSPSQEMGLFRLYVCLPDRGPQWAARAWASVAPLLYREAVTVGHSALFIRTGGAEGLAW